MALDITTVRGEKLQNQAPEQLLSTRKRSKKHFSTGSLEEPLNSLCPRTSGLDPGRRTNQSFGYECRRRESTRCREQHHATRQNSNKKPSVLSGPRQTGALLR